MVDVFLQGHQTMHLFDNEFEVKDWGIVELECFIFKLQKPKSVILNWMWREKGKSNKFFLNVTWCQNVAFVELDVWKPLLWELLSLPQNSKLITLLQPNNFLLLVDRKIHEHLNFFNEHCEAIFCPSTSNFMKWLYLEVHMLLVKEKMQSVFLNVKLHL
jgi:hypothetical protein